MQQQQCLQHATNKYEQPGLSSRRILSPCAVNCWWHPGQGVSIYCLLQKQGWSSMAPTPQTGAAQAAAQGSAGA